MARPESLNDYIPPTTKIRRDQHKKLKGIVDTNAKFPQVAIGLVRDLIKTTSMREVVGGVSFSDAKYQPMERDAKDPKYITVYTKGFGDPSTDFIGTAYHFSLQPDQKFTAPTL
jgi:hypothetical protein